MSDHDIGVIRRAMARATMQGMKAHEIHVSDRRLSLYGLRVLGLPVRLRSELTLNDGLLIVEGRDPISFDFEAEAR